jgi:hypothetical protein
MVIDQVSHELGFAGCDIYDIIVEADVTEDHSEHDLSPEDVLVEQA